ncbi:hypothetical protein PAEPH01_2198, partial [Pancytospora epiphaga]
NILKSLNRTQDLISHIRKNPVILLPHRHQFIQEIFINNLRFNSKSYSKYYLEEYVVKIHDTLSTLNAKGNIIMHREHYFYQHFLFHSRLSIFNGMSMPGYIQGLSKIGRFDNRKERDQVTRDLVFSGYYYEAAIRLKNMSDEFAKKQGILEFKKSVEKEYEIYKNKVGIERERKMFRMC